MTSQASITYAGVSYLDRTRALETGEVQPGDTELRYLPFTDVAELFRRMAQDVEFDAAEMSLSTYVMMRSRGDDRLVGIPVFPSRAFRHSQIYLHTGSGIERPEDLRGRDVGVPEYQMTAALWIRGILADEYGVGQEQIAWKTGGLWSPDFHERLRHDPPPGVTIDRIPGDRTLEQELEDGGIDALVTAHAPKPFREGSPSVTRLFPDYREVEQRYWQKTRLFPIMHLVVLRRDVYEANPELALQLLDAFHESKRRARARLRDFDTPAVAHPWIGAEVDELDAFFGGDPFAYGVEANRNVVETVVRYSVSQGLAERQVSVDELFAPETHAWDRRAEAEPAT
jgi:4,5-dihydroxyphthalate decarboxylase